MLFIGHVLNPTSEACIQVPHGTPQVIKHLVDESRPENARAADPGMPSSHANSLAFFGCYIALSLTTGGSPSAASTYGAFAVASATLGLVRASRA